MNRINTRGLITIFKPEKKMRNIHTPKIYLLIACIFFLLSTNALSAQRGRGHRVHQRPSVRINHLPAGHVRISINNHPHYYHNGIFYRAHSSGFVVTRAPLGARIKVLPIGYATIHIGPIPYYYYYGTYYRYIPEEKVYVVVESPEETKLADDNVTKDKISLIDGSVLIGYYIGGNQDTVKFEYGGKIHEIPANSIIDISFAPPAAIDESQKQE